MEKSFEFQKWPVYQKALGFAVEAGKFSERIPREPLGPLRDQLRRASQSIPLNIAEGCSRYSKKEKINFWRIARGSVFECVAVLDIIAKESGTHNAVETMNDDLTAMGKMLSGLIKYIERNGK